MFSGNDTMAMTDTNPYAPPAVDELPPKKRRPRKREKSSPYYAVSILKLVLLSTLTFGLYDLYWVYRQWSGIRDHDRVRIRPFWRAFWSFWFLPSLFNDVRRRLGEAGLRADVPATPLAVIYILCNFLGRIGDRTDNALLGMVAFFSIIPLAIMQNAINRHVRHCDEDADMNSRFTVWNIVVIILGCLVFFVVAFGDLLLD